MRKKCQKETYNSHLDPDPATQIDVDPDPQPWQIGKDSWIWAILMKDIRFLYEGYKNKKKFKENF
jgi:hypothetical protein